MSGKKSVAQVREELKLARKGGSRAKQWKQAGDALLYDEVSENVYKSIVQDRLQRDDFVEDDGVDGYNDDGMDVFEGEAHESEEEREVKRHIKQSSRAKSKPKPKHQIPDPAPMSAYRPIKSEAKDSEFLDSLLEGMVAAPAVPKKSNIRKRKSSANQDRADFSSFRDNGAASSDGPDDFPDVPSFGKRREPFSSEDESFPTPAKRFKAENGAGISLVQTAATKVGKLHVDDFEDEFEDEYGPVDLDMDLDAIVKKEEEIPISLSNVKRDAELKAKNEPTGPPAWLAVHANLPVAAKDSVGSGESNLLSTRVQALEEDGSLRFFWLDYLEADGRIYLVGKVLDKATNRFVSASITVENMQRNLFVLPRERRKEDDYETDVEPDQLAVFRDFDEVRRRFNIGGFKAKWVNRKYAFGEPGVPTAETQWLKVIYPFSEPAIPSDISSPNFARVFGTSTSAFELFVLKRKIKGPCWLQIRKPEVENKGVSWCKLEATVFDPKNVGPLNDDNVKDMPPLTIMSLAMRTVVNHKDNKREIVCVAAHIWEGTQIEDTTPIETQTCIAATLVRPLEKYPRDFESQAAKSKSRMQPLLNERALLSNLLALLQRHDPDVIIGHDFLGVSLDVLLHRLRELKIEHWSRISRFKRKGWPNIGKQGTNLKFLHGRLLCDLTSDGAKGMIASTTWSLTEMVASQLKQQRQDIDPDDTALYFDCETSTAQELKEFVQHCELDSFFQMSIASKVQILPLTRQLTNLAGNSWNKTLNGGRAERNEYILLHEFHSLKYICPDKTWGKKAAAAAKIDAEEGDGGAAAITTKSRRDKYKGGLVFEPKRGLWDKFILVMDFNSLYPSIIQEYNIDFTTVERKTDGPEGEDQIPDVPPSNTPQGVLPRLIAELVSRRRGVKALMKDPKSTPAQRMQWDIRQQALKLTANSMYGCLGFEYSRFYAMQLAALTTFKGREILTNTRELAESMGLDVVYGDTDSVFVNSNHLDLAEALKVAHQFKRAVNERYRLLEIDVDGVFQRLLLLQKKKYAAIKIENNKPTMEVKGLDMKRREYCPLSKNASKEVLEHILSGDETEVVVERIHDYLTTIGQNVRSGTIGLDDFVIFKRLGKNPEEYPDAKGQPHVQVALRMKSKGQSAKAGDVISYVFCLGEDGSSSKTAQAERAHHPDEVRRSDGQLKIDYEHYLGQQVLPPVERLCDPIEGTDRSRLAECLGLDPNKYHANTAGAGEEKVFGMLSSQIPDKIRYKDCSPFTVACRKCKKTVPWTPLGREDSRLVTPSGIACIDPDCQAPIVVGSLVTQLEAQARHYISKYYEGWMVCNDSVCGKRTRMMRVYGRRCLDCSGIMNFEYDDTALYTQLLYYASLFDTQKVTESARGSTRQDFVTGAVGNNHDTFVALKRVVDKYLDKCGRRWVDLEDLFGFMKLKSNTKSG